MYNLTEAAIEAFKLRRASIQIPVNLISGEDIPSLTENDLKSATLERVGVSGKTIEIGAARVYELKLRLKNPYGEFDGISFDGAKIFPRIIAGQYTCPLGYFTIDGHEKGTGYIELTALDRMVLFDKTATYEQVAFPITVKNLVFAACTACGVDSSRLDIDDLPNSDYSVESAPDDDVTWRQIIMWCGELMGVNSYMDAEGYFCMAWCNQTSLRITASDRYSHKLFENDVTVEGVEVIDDENEVTYLAGSDSGYKFTISGNALLTHDHENVAAELGAKIVGFSYRPFSATTLSMPNIFPYDMMTYVEPNGETHPVLITGCKFALNGNTELESTGESETTSGYAYANYLTSQERRIIASLKKEDEKTRQELTTREQALIRMNEVIANAMGLYFIPVTSEIDGSTKYYFTNRPTLEESTLIYVFNSGGFAWSTKWEGDKTIWKYGITSEGNAFLNYLSLNKLDANYIEVESIVGKINESSGDSELSITADHISFNGESLSLLLNGVVTDEDLNTTLEAYVTSSSLSTTLSSYVTDNTLSSRLQSYVTSSSLSTTLSSYVTSDDVDELASTIESKFELYVTSESLSVELTEYALREDGEDTSFKYSLTADGCTMSANGKTVLTVDKTGLGVTGKITANSGKIAGLDIYASEEMDDEGNITGATRTLRNRTDTFRIQVKEDADGNATSTEVLITDLTCDKIKSNNGLNEIDLHYIGESTSITATLSYTSSLTATVTGTPTGLNWYKRTATFTISLSGTLLEDKTFSIDWGVENVSSLANTAHTSTITIPKGTSGTYQFQANYINYYGLNIALNYARFTENGERTITFETAIETEQKIKITGNVIPNGDGAQDFGNEDREWNNGYFKTLYANGSKVGELQESGEIETRISTKETLNGFYTIISGENSSINVISVGKLRFITIDFPYELTEDRWYLFDLSSYVSQIYSVQATTLAPPSASLDGTDHGAALATNVITTSCYIGCDYNPSKGGFTALVIGVKN